MSFYFMHRGWMDQAAFLAGREPFDRRSAWVWLIEEAAWEARRMNIAGRTITLQRGQVGHSIRFMAEAWKWEKTKVERFLSRLKTETMIETETATGHTIITICNYDKYQAIPGFNATPNETQNATVARQQRDSSATNENQVNKVIKEEEGTPSELCPSQRADGVDLLGAVLPSATVLAMPKRDAEEAVELWNAMATGLGLAVVRQLTVDRRRKVVLRLKDAGGIDGWKAALEHVRNSRHLRGETPGKNGGPSWACTFDYLISQSGFIKVMEGNFRDRGPSPGAGGGGVNHFAGLTEKLKEQGII